MHQVAVTGMGIVSPLGTSVREFGRRMFAGESGTVDIRGEDVALNFPVPAAGRVPRTALIQPTILRDIDANKTLTNWRYTGASAEEAIQELPPGIAVDAIVYGAEDGIDFCMARESFRAFDPETFDWNATHTHVSLELIRRILAWHGNGQVEDRNLISISNACVSSNQAIGVAFQRIRAGLWKRAVVGGVWAQNVENLFMNFYMVGALSVADVPAAEASRPFSKDRSGMIMGEGAATLVLESREEAEARGARILGFVTGYAASSDAFRLTDGRSDGLGASTAMDRAIKDAGKAPPEISAISAHGTSTPMNDRLETLAIKNVFGSHAYKLPVTSLKSQVGHPLVASGAFDAIASILMLQEQRLAPTINYKEADPECDLDYVPNTCRNADLNVILSNSLGFGGQNACVVFERGI